MIELRRPRDSAAADEVTSTLRDLVVAFREVMDDGIDGPVLTDTTATARTPEEIERFLEDLRRDVLLWNKYQSDTCYIDGDDGTC